jgi:DNA-binding NarL/FixJ family response regulator
MSMIHVLVADGVPLFRCGIRAALESTPECQVVAEATERRGILHLLQEQQPDVLVLDAGLLAPDDLFEVAGALRPLACGLVVLTASADEEQLFQSDKTVKNHITSLFKKLSVDGRTAAVVHALRHRLISLEPAVRFDDRPC